MKSLFETIQKLNNASYETDTLVQVIQLDKAIEILQSADIRAIGLDFVAANHQRALRWHNGNLGNWSPAEWGNAIAGEVGEFCNIAKKILRWEKKMQQRAVSAEAAEDHQEEGEFLRAKAATELADVITYCVVTACAMNIDIDKAVRDKFNEISEREGFPERV